MSVSPTFSLAHTKDELSRADLLHLLRRCLFSAGHKELSFFKNKNINQCLDVLLKQSPPLPPPLQDDPDMEDPLVPKGVTWVNAPFENEEIDKSRRIALKAWWTGQLLNRDYSLTEKMTLFWHNQFVTEMEMVKDARYSYRYLVMLRSHALGNFRKLIRDGTTDISMLVYLNGNTNSKEAPNENYGRELMELFTLGKGNGVKYTEEDVQTAARVLSGWKDNRETFRADFHPELHDTGDKKFSAFFNHAVIKGKAGMEGMKETDELIEMIFAKEETARFLCRNLYRWFVCSRVDETVEQKIITPLARILIENNFNVAPVLRTLLSSEHFFDPVFRGCIVKSPVDFFVGVTKQFEIQFPANLSDTHLCWAHYYFNIGGLSMSLGDPPNVAGWPAYHQEPKYHQWWINSYTLGFRTKITDSLFNADGTNCNGPRIKFDYLAFVKKLKSPENINALVDDCVELLLAVKVSDAVKHKLKAVLLSGQDMDEIWTREWNKFAADPANEMTRSTIETRLKSFFMKIMNMPEFQMT